MPHGDEKEGTVRRWSPDLRQCLSTFKPHQGSKEMRIEQLAVSPDSCLVASGGFDGTVRLFTPEGTVVHVLWGHPEMGVRVCFDATGARVASGDTAGIVRVWTLSELNLDKLSEDEDEVVAGVLAL